MLLIITIFSNTLNASNVETESFETHGYVIIKDFFDEQTIAQIHEFTVSAEKEGLKSLAKMQNCETTQNRFVVVPEKSNPAQICRVENLAELNPEFYDHITDIVINKIRDISEEDYVPFKDKINFKFPGGGAFLPHQDYPAYKYFEPQIHITAAISVDSSTEENGCLYFAPNWTKAFINDPFVDQKLLRVGRAIIPHNNDGILPEYASRLDWQIMPLGRRDLVLFDSYVPHKSYNNLSNNARRAIFITFSPKRNGEHKAEYYDLKVKDPHNVMFHHGNPTK